MKTGGSFMAPKLRKEIGDDPEYSRCALTGMEASFGPCGGRVTREHALIYAGKKIQKRWSIIPCCAAHHGVDQYQDSPTEVSKDVRVWVAVNRATDDELLAVSKVTNYIRERIRLNVKYGVYISPPIPTKVPFTVTQKNIKPFLKRAVSGLDQKSQEDREIVRFAQANGYTVEQARAFLQETSL